MLQKVTVHMLLSHQLQLPLDFRLAARLTLDLPHPIIPVLVDSLLQASSPLDSCPPLDSCRPMPLPIDFPRLNPLCLSIPLFQDLFP